jgi:hypothetical protein
MKNLTPSDMEAMRLVYIWIAQNRQTLSQDLTDHLVESVGLYIERQHSESQSHFMSRFEELTNSLSAVRSTTGPQIKPGEKTGMEIYADIIEEWNRQNPPQSTDFQASLAWHRAQGLLPSLG